MSMLFPMSKTSPIEIEVLNRQIRTFSGLWFKWPRFPPSLEDDFEAETSERRCKRLWFEGLFALTLFNFFLIADYYGEPREFRRALIVRLAVVTPICLLVNTNLLRSPGRHLRELSISFALCLAAMGQLYLSFEVSRVASAYMQPAVLTIILFANSVSRLRMGYAIGTSFVILAGDGLFLLRDHLLAPNEKIFGFGLALSTTALTLLANYSACREERLAYLLSERDELLAADLNRLNAQLLQRSESDELTGLANRRSFDARFADLWRQAVIGGTVLSVIMVDVDRFKQLNDRYGHLYGDQVLKRIGSLLQQALRAKDDFAARYGGEEFVILLPATSQVAARHVAERLRKMVELAGFPALDESQKPLDVNTTATVSCGVATSYPTSEANRERLLEAADKAMYQAKAQGRNCVCSAPGNAGIGVI
jgi:diguanylate cyclase (GGDEF)-like protein